ncbi:hypothetical protein Droror1_Dr00013939 [Drosera rotundifolia]
MRFRLPLSTFLFTETPNKARPLLHFPLSHLRTLTLISYPMAAEISAEDLAKYGFDRPEMNTASLAFTVDPPLDRHVFLCYKSVADWPPKVENSETDLLPKKFSGAIRGRKNDMKVKVREFDV